MEQVQSVRSLPNQVVSDILRTHFLRGVEYVSVVDKDFDLVRFVFTSSVS